MPDADQKYKILSKLDSGGMAEIYLGVAESLQGFTKQVAIKRILPHLTQNKKFVAMFLDEARLSLRLAHTNIVHVFDIGHSGNTFFIVMEYVDGLNLRTLTESLRRQGKRLDISVAIFLIMEVCKGLGYAHDMVSPDDGKPLGIVHRDISPPNILISKMGEIKLVDFGLAKAASQLEQTDPGVVKGKFSYLSPEAASGKEVDFLTDIFACGIILYELLSGRRLFYGETDYQTVELVRQAKVPSLTALNPDIPQELDDIVHKALARNSGDRFQHAYELQDTLAQFLFSNGLKVTNRDVSLLIRQCMAERRMTIPPPTSAGSVIDALIQEEIHKFTSLDRFAVEEPLGARPLSPQDLNGSSVEGMDLHDFIDPRGWTDELKSNPQIVIASSPSASDPSSSKTAPTSGFTPLAQILEEENSASEQNVVLLTTPIKKSNPLRGFLIALIVCLVLGVSTVLMLHLLGFIGEGEDNQDIVNTK